MLFLLIVVMAIATGLAWALRNVGWGWVPLLLAAALMALVWPPSLPWLLLPVLQPGKLVQGLLVWPLVPLAVLAFLAFRPRWAWRAPGMPRLATLMALGWVAMVGVGALAPVGPQEVLEVWREPAGTAAGEPGHGVVVAAAIAALLLRLAAIALLGHVLGRLLAWAGATLWRVSGRGVGIYTPRLKLRWDRGDDHFLVAHDGTGKTVPTKRLPLHEAPTPVVQQMGTKKKHIPKVSSITARNQYGDRIHGTIESEGYYVTVPEPSVWWVGKGPGMTYYHVKAPEVRETNLALQRLAPFAQAARDAWELARAAERQQQAEAAAAAAEARERQAREAEARATRDEQARREQGRRAAHDAMAALVRQAGVDTSAMWSRYGHDLDGRLAYAIAADRSGRGFAVYADGAQTWVGHWRGASCRLEDGALQIQVDDPAYREQHLSQRRFSLGARWEKAEQQAWLDRIELLAATPG